MHPLRQGDRARYETVNTALFPRGADLEAYDWRHLQQSYRHYVFPNATVLEIGASNIGRTRDLAQHCQRLIGLELFPDRWLADNGNITYLLGDWQRLRDVLAADSIDIVVSSHVIEHVPNDCQALLELERVLKPGGVALLTTPNRTRLARALIESVTGPWAFPCGEHVREYTMADLSTLLAASPFKDHFRIVPVFFGVHGYGVRVSITNVPSPLRQWANFWEIHLFKERRAPNVTPLRW